MAKRPLSIVFGLLGPAIVLFACGGDDTSGPTGNGCDELVSAICGKLQSCFPGLVGTGFGSVATCAERIAIDCANEASAPGTGFTPEYARSCATAYDDASCAEVPALGLGECVAPSGSLGTGEKCANNTQCQTGYCRGDGSGLCGACANRLEGGAKCDQDPGACPVGSACSANSQCVALGKAGDPCSPDLPCVNLLICVEGHCDLGQSAGESCETVPCAVPQQLACDKTMTCHLYKIGAPGDACENVGMDYVICGGGSECSNDKICVAAGQDGAACGGTDGTACQNPARCVSGTCQLADTCF
jgi:hypothetical protein